jgi:hypothetical protein
MPDTEPPSTSVELHAESWTSVEPEAEPTVFSDLPDDAIERIATACADDLCEGVTSLCFLSRCDRRLHGLVLSAATLARCAAQHGIMNASHASLALLDVIETITGLGTNRVYVRSGIELAPLDACC